MMPEQMMSNQDDIALAQRIYGDFHDHVAVKCVGCIAEMIAEHRVKAEAAARVKIWTSLQRAEAEIAMLKQRILHGIATTERILEELQ